MVIFKKGLVSLNTNNFRSIKSICQICKKQKAPINGKFPSLYREFHIDRFIVGYNKNNADALYHYYCILQNNKISLEYDGINEDLGVPKFIEGCNFYIGDSKLIFPNYGDLLNLSRKISSSKLPPKEFETTPNIIKRGIKILEIVETLNRIDSVFITKIDSTKNIISISGIKNKNEKLVLKFDNLFEIIIKIKQFDGHEEIISFNKSTTWKIFVKKLKLTNQKKDHKLLLKNKYCYICLKDIRSNQQTDLKIVDDQAFIIHSNCK